MPDISVVTDSLSQGIKLSNLNLSPAPEMVGAFEVEPLRKELNMEYGIFEKNMDDGDSVLLDNFVVRRARDLSDPYECSEDVFEGTLEGCHNYMAINLERK